MQREDLGCREVVVGRLALVPAGHHGASRDTPGESTQLIVKRAGQDPVQIRLDADDLQR
jgi:hypothetical protein